MTMAKTFREAESSCKCTNPDCVQKLAVSAPGTNPGTFYVSMKITHPDLSEQLFNEWYDKTHIPDAFKTRAFKEAYRWKALDSAAERPFLNTYPLEDVDFLNSKEFKSTAWSTIPVQDDRLPGSGLVFDSVGFDMRCYEISQVLEREPSSPAQANFMFVVGITSHTAEELYEWECQDNAADRCMKPGWLRTERYQLSTTVPISKDMKTMKNQDDLLANRISDVLTIRYYDSQECPEDGMDLMTGKCARLERCLAAHPNQECAWYKKMANFKK